MLDGFCYIGYDFYRKDVVEILGRPDRVEGDSWYYGESTIYFSAGSVIGWVRAPAEDLKIAAALVPVGRGDSSGKLWEKLFGLGDTASRVHSVQGAPLIATDRVWSYSASEVYFEDGHVVGWFNSPVDILYVDAPPGEFGRIAGSRSE